MSRAICAGFEETTEPSVCLSGGMRFFLSLSKPEVEWHEYELEADAFWLQM